TTLSEAGDESIRHGKAARDPVRRGVDARGVGAPGICSEIIPGVGVDRVGARDRGESERDEQSGHDGSSDDPHGPPPIGASFVPRLAGQSIREKIYTAQRHYRKTTGHVGGRCRIGKHCTHAIIRRRESGETGRRAGLRIQWAKALGGSTPPSRTKYLRIVGAPHSSTIRERSWILAVSWPRRAALRHTVWLIDEELRVKGSRRA